MLPLETGGLVSALQGLDVKPELIEEIVATLTATGNDLPQGFETAAIAPAEFGNRSSADLLGTHYNKAYDVMQATIDGIAADLVAFGQTAKVAARYVDEADLASADDLAAARAAVEQLQDLSANAQNHQNYDDARNDPTTGQPDTEGGR